MSVPRSNGSNESRMDTVGVPRPVRVAFPVEVEFEGTGFKIDEFTANLSVGGIFLPADKPIPVRTEGSLTFRLSQWDEPFTVRAEVVWSAPPADLHADQPKGLGLMFIDLSAGHKAKLERLITGIRDGSVTEAIRRSLPSPGTGLLKELRKRPTDQKVMFALSANGQEIDTIVQEGSPAAVQRLLQNPRVQIRHIQKILRDTRSPVTILLEIYKEQRWMKDSVVRTLFCAHPFAPVEKVMEFLPALPLPGLKTLSRNRNLRQQIQDKVEQLLKAKTGR
jgi:uncharacterized protein (TIGR02266 family)